MLSRLFKKYCQALQSLIEASAEVSVDLDGDMREVVTVKAHYEQDQEWLEVSFLNHFQQRTQQRLSPFTQFTVAFPPSPTIEQLPLDLNPKPYHIELRLDTRVQEILLEDDIFRLTEQEAIDYLLSWAKLYDKIFHPKEGLVVVCTNSWTQETLYQTSLRDA